MNLYVGNLNFRLSEDELRQIFEEYGEVTSVKIITDKYSGRSKGFGFVDMVERDDAATAMENLNGSEVQGRALKVNEATQNKKPQRRDFRRDNRRDY